MQDVWDVPYEQNILDDLPVGASSNAVGHEFHAVSQHKVSVFGFVLFFKAEIHIKHSVVLTGG